ncbi:MAG TPA: glycosyltransferase family 2 protein [Planctomycetes bacterium]|nr:glycosyltransferase family 2 protein [Planctomycetota bacterium]
MDDEGNPESETDSLTDPTVELVIPTLNEAHVLEGTVHEVLAYLRESFPYPARILIADNGSTDGTGELAERLARELEDVRCLRLHLRGRGRALKEAWTSSDADIVAYTDVDLSTELVYLEPLCRLLASGAAELATGSRLLPDSQTTRGLKREIISRTYNLVLKTILGVKFSDAQCGFKAATRRAVRDLVPMVKDDGWFFDTELLVLGEKLGYEVGEVPVKWTDDDDSRVRIVSTAWDDLKGVFRLRRWLWSSEFRRTRRTLLDTPKTEPTRG